MTKLNKIKVGSLAVAMVLMSIVLSVAQTTNPATGMQSTKPKNPAAAELKSFQTDPANPELSNTRLSLLKAKAELEAGQAANTLSQEEISSLTRRIGLLETKVKEMSPTDQGTPQLNAREKQIQMSQRDAIMVQIKESGSISREQFVKLDAADQKFALLNSVKISDLVNATSEQMRTQQEGIFYIPASGFSSYSFEKQMHILNNPSTYLIGSGEIQAVSSAPAKKDAELNSYTLTRAQFNALSPERRQAIESSGKFVVVD